MMVYVTAVKIMSKTHFHTPLDAADSETGAILRFHYTVRV